MLFTNHIKVPPSTENTHVNFTYACERLGIDLKTTSSPEAKGRIEHLLQTLQSRLIPEFRIAKIECIEEANYFLSTYVEEFYKQFSLQIDSTKNVFESQPTKETINETLAVIKTRVIDKGHTIRFENKTYIPINEKSIHVHFMRNTKCNVISAFDESLYLSTNDEIFGLELLPERLEKLEEFDHIVKKKPEPRYIPPMSHRMKHASYQNYLARQQRSNESVYA